jgi:hypothetical protein
MVEPESKARVALARKHHGIVTHAIQRWRQGGVIDDPTAARLTDSIVVASFDWQRTARYAFIISIFCLVIAVGAILADEVLMKLLMRIFNAPAIVKCGFFAAVSAGIFWYGLFLRKRYPHRLYGNESVFFLGVLALAAAVFFLGVAIDTGTGHYSVLFLIASVLYALLGLWFPSALVWVFGLLSLGAWMGTETGYVSGHGMYFLGMNYPLRFVIFGAALTVLGVAGQHSFVDVSAGSSKFKDRLLSMSPQTTVIGLLNLFVALWIMSIFGNYGDMTQWEKVRQYELLHWSLLFGAVAIAAIWYGLKRDDGVLRGFGLTFLFINLYTRFFEYFWDSIHKAVFFAVLAASFWYLGSRAEAIWHFGQRTLQSNSGVQPTPTSGRG